MLNLRNTLSNFTTPTCGARGITVVIVVEVVSEVVVADGVDATGRINVLALRRIIAGAALLFARVTEVEV